MLSKFFSRKFLVAVVSFITVSVVPNLSASTQAKYQVFIAAAYIIGQSYADRGAGTGSQGTTTTGA